MIAMMSARTEYVDNQNRTIIQLRNVESGKLHFRGKTAFHEDWGSRVMKAAFQFDINARSPREAFENWDNAFRAAVANPDELAKDLEWVCFEATPAFWSWVSTATRRHGPEPEDAREVAEIPFYAQ